MGWLAGKKEFNKQNKGKQEQKKRKKLSKPGMPITEVAQAIGAAWNKADDATKAKFQKQADKAKVKAQKAMAKYKKGREYKAYLSAVAASKLRIKAERKAAKKTAQK